MHRFLITLLALASLISLQSCYYATQGYYLFKYTYSAKKIDTILEDENTNIETQDFLDIVRDIQGYAQSIHLKNKKKFNSYKEIDQDYLVAVVHAAEALSIEPYKWHYPFLGGLPYKGFYRIDDALKEAEKLKKKNYDVYVRKVSAFSTLNTLPDPLYSFMKDYPTHRLAETLLHEQVHSTIWIKHQDAFNEQLATFIGRKAMIAYITQTYGKDSKEYSDITKGHEDDLAFRSILLDTKDKLKEIYESTNISDEQKLIAKDNILRAQQAYFEQNYDKLFKEDSYKEFRIDQQNNAFFSLISTYEENNQIFEKSLARCNDDIGVFVSELYKITSEKEYKQYKKDPYKYLEIIPISK